MECSEPGAIRDEELLAYMDGMPVRPAVLAHLAHCQCCSSHLATYQRMDRKLIQRLYRWDCPTNQVLGEYQLDLLSSEQAVDVRDHLTRCALCATEVVILSKFLANDESIIEPVPISQQVATHSHNSHSLRDAKTMMEKWRTEG